MRHNVCLILFNLWVLSTVSGQLFEDDYLSYFEQEPDSCRLIISKCFIGEDSMPSSIDTISYDSVGQRKSVVTYRNNAFECARLFTYNSYGDVIAEYFINTQRDTLVNFYSCSYNNGLLTKKVSSSGLTNVSYGYNLNSQIDFVVSENDIADQNFIFGYPETFEFEVYENFAQYTIYKGSTPFRMIKTKPDNPQYVLYSERCTYYFGRITKCVITNYNGDAQTIVIKYRGKQPVQLTTPTIIMYAKYNKNGAVTELTETKEGKTLERILFEYVY